MTSRRLDRRHKRAEREIVRRDVAQIKSSLRVGDQAAVKEKMKQTK